MEELFSQKTLKQCAIVLAWGWTVAFAAIFASNVYTGMYDAYTYAFCIFGVMVVWAVYLLNKYKQALPKSSKYLRYGLVTLSVLLVIAEILLTIFQVHIDHLSSVTVAIIVMFIVTEDWQ